MKKALAEWSSKLKQLKDKKNDKIIKSSSNELNIRRIVNIWRRKINNKEKVIVKQIKAKWIALIEKKNTKKKVLS